MPTVIEICFYETGLRLAQYGILFALGTQTEFNQLCCDEVSTSIECLKAALDRLAAATGAPTMTYGVLAGQLRVCRDLLDGQRDLQRRQLGDHPPVKRMIGCVRKIQNFVAQTANKRHGGDEALQPLKWFWLGTTICAFGLPLPEALREEEMFWGSSEPGRPIFFNELLSQLCVTVRQLKVPKASDNPQFPYCGAPYSDHWVQLEGGLAKLKQSFAPSPPDGPDGRTSAFLGLILDHERRKVRRNENSACFEDSVLQWEVFKTLFQQQGVKIGFKGLAPLWSSFARAPNPSHATVTATISEIRKRIRPLGVGIKNRRNVGWSLETADGGNPPPSRPSGFGHERRPAKKIES